MKTVDISVGGDLALGVEIPLSKAPLVLAKGRKGFVMCGYLNIEAASKLGESAAMVRGVKTVDDLLEAKVVEVTPAAEAKGVKKGMTGREALERLC